MKYFLAALITIWVIAAIYLYINYVIFHKTFGTAGRKKEKSKDGKNADYERINIVAADEIILSGKLFTPPVGDGERSVILCHSFRKSGEKDFKKEISVYKKLGYNVLVIEQRSHGKSDGKISTYGILESYDTVYWCKWLELRFGTGCSIVIHGKEMGAFAAVAAGANSELPQNVTGIVADSVYDSVFNVFSEIAVKKYGFFSKMIIPTVNMFCRNFAGFDMRDFELKKLAKKVRIPVLYLNTDKNSEIVKNTENSAAVQPLESFLKERGLL